jgi:tetratricopeptide (TPR) repeat protein
MADANAILSFYVCSTPVIQDYIGTVPDNNDNLPIVEMSKVVSMARNPAIIESFFQQKQEINTIIIPGTLSEENRSALDNHFLAEKLLIEATLKNRYQNKPQEALQRLIQSTELAPSNYVLHKNLAILYYTGGNFHQAVKSLIRAIHIHPNISAEHEHLGIILFEAGSYADALHAFENALLLDPERPLSRYYRAAIFKMKGNTLLAKSELKEIIKVFPNYIEPYYSLALIYEEQDNYSRALAYYQHCIRLNADYKNVKSKIEKLTK